jgi:hypothetical protein
VNASGQIAFMSRVDGVSRNQGIFVADDTGLHAIAIGCGDGGGSGVHGSGVGDPTPIGGTFAGFFGGTSMAPTINDAGDVLFLCDVDGGSAIRALFLYRAATDDIVKVAAVGDPSPAGGSFEAVGPGSLNNAGQVAFIAMGRKQTEINAYLWQAGTTTTIVAVGDPAPGGGKFTLIGTEIVGFTDGTEIPTGPVPALNEAGDIAFRGHVQGGLADVGLFFSSGGMHDWYLKLGDATPDGGTFTYFWTPILNNNGEIAFEADYEPTPGNYNSGWFAGSPGRWRKVLAFHDSVCGGTVIGLAVSRNPFKPFDDRGNLLIWTKVLLYASDEELLVLCSPTGEFTDVAWEGDATPLGGAVGTMNAWPSINALGEATLAALTPGAPGVTQAYFLATADLALTADAATIPAATGGSVGFGLDAGTGSAGRDYILAGSMSGTDPGTLLPGGMATIPINRDAFTNFILANLNGQLFADFRGVLDGSGQAGASLNAPPLPPAYVGRKMDFAFALMNPFDFASNAVRVEIVP